MRCIDRLKSIRKKIKDQINEDWLRSYSHWQNFKGFFSLSVVRLFITWFAGSPIIVKSLENTPDKIKIPFSESYYTIHTQLPFSWVLLWFASLAYVLALVLYHIKCPSFVKKNPNYGEYDKYKNSPRWLVWQLYFLGKKKKQEFSEAKKQLLEKNYGIIP